MAPRKTPTREAREVRAHPTAAQLQQVLPVGFLQQAVPAQMRGRAIMYLEERGSSYVLNFNDGTQSVEVSIQTATDEEKATALAGTHIYEYTPASRSETNVASQPTEQMTTPAPIFQPAVVSSNEITYTPMNHALQPNSAYTQPPHVVVPLQNGLQQQQLVHIPQDMMHDAELWTGLDIRNDLMSHFLEDLALDEAMSNLPMDPSQQH